MKKATALIIVLFSINSFAKGPLFAGFAPVPKGRPEMPKVEKKTEAVTSVELPSVEIPTDEEIAETCHTYYSSCRERGGSHAKCGAVRDYCAPSSLRM